MIQEILRYLWERRTTVLGYVVTALGIMATSDLFTATQIKWFLLINGILTATLGHYNNRQVTHETPQTKQGGFARPLMLAFLLAVAVPVTVMLPGCGINRPLEEAKTLEQKAFATYGSFVIVKEQAAKLYVDPSTPEEVKKALREANNAATGPINLMYEGAMALKDARADLDAGRTTEEKVLIAAQELLNWYLAARPLYESFDAEVQKVRK